MFKEIPNTNGNYSCDEYGNIKSNKRAVYNKGSNKTYMIKERILKPYKNNKGYFCVDLRVDKKTVRLLVHRIVAEVWLNNPNNYPIINHKDNNPENNYYKNLEWCDYSYNIKYCIQQNRMNFYSPKRIASMYSPKTYLYKPVEQYTLKGEFIAEYDSVTLAAKEIYQNKISKANINAIKGNISSCCNNKAHTSYGYIWKFKDAG